MYENQIHLFGKVLKGFNCAPSDFFFQLNHLHTSFHLNRKYKFFIHRQGSAFKLDIDLG